MLLLRSSPLLPLLLLLLLLLLRRRRLQRLLLRLLASVCFLQWALLLPAMHLLQNLLLQLQLLEHLPLRMHSLNPGSHRVYRPKSMRALVPRRELAPKHAAVALKHLAAPAPGSRDPLDAGRHCIRGQHARASDRVVNDSIRSS